MPCKIQLINPNTCVEMTEKMAQAAVKVAALDSQVIAVSPKQGVASIEGHYDEAIAAVGVLELIQAAPDVDGYIIACFGDPALDAARELATAPVIGIAEAAFHMATLVATKFSIVTTLARTQIIAEHLLHKYGFAQHCAKIRCIDLPVLSLEHEPEQAYALLRQQCLTAKQQDGIGAIVLGCGGMADLAERISAELEIPVIDGVSAAVKLVEALHAMQIRTSKWGDYAYPRQK